MGSSEVHCINDGMERRKNEPRKASAGKEPVRRVRVRFGLVKERERMKKVYIGRVASSLNDILVNEEGI